MQRVSRAFVVLVLLGSAGCSTTDLVIRVLPSEAPISGVTVDGKPAKRDGNRWRASLDLSTGDSRDVGVVVTSKDGIRQEESVLVKGGSGERQEDIDMPAAVAVSIASGEAAAVTIGGDYVLPDSEGVYEKYVEGGTPVTVVAESADGVVDDQVVDPEAGLRTEVTFHLDVKAKFNVKPSVHYGDRVLFDATPSTPSAALRYQWDFGDGTLTEFGTSQVIEHEYAYDPASGTSREYEVSLRVMADNGKLDVESRALSVSLDMKPLTFDVDVYPRGPASYGIEEALQFKLVPRTGFSPADTLSFQIDFGDGTVIDSDALGQPLAVDPGDESARAIVVSHAYDRAGRFEPKITYSHERAGLEGPFAAELQYSTTVLADGLTVTQHYPTDEELEELAWAALYARFDELLESVQVDGRTPVKLRPLALTSVDDANFEMNDSEHFVPVVERLTRYLVGDDYLVLEKSSQVLARLAPEAIVDIREEIAEGANANPDRKPVYREYLDYGLRTTHESVEQPIVYSVELEGTRDRINQFDQANSALSSEEDLLLAGEQGPQVQSESERGRLTMALRNLPILVARFDTADTLVAFRVTQGPRVDRVQEALYDVTLDEPMTRKTASVELHVRILDRSGTILAVGDIRGEATELVLEDEAP